MELVVIVALTLVMVPVVVLTTGWLRVVLGLLFLLLFPGYTLTAAVFPKKGSLDTIERVALSFVLSIAVVPLIGLVLSYTPLGIALYPITGSTALFVLVASAVAIWRRRRLPKEERFHVLPKIELFKWNRLSRLERILSIILVLSVLVAAGAFVYVVAVPRLGEKFTEFYMPAGGDIPGKLAVGESLMVTLRTVNHEHEDASYRIEIRVDGEAVQQPRTFVLAHGEKRDETVTVILERVGPQQQVEFLLYKDAGTLPYRSLYLSISGVEALT